MVGIEEHRLRLDGECKFSIVTRLTECYDPDGNAVNYWEPSDMEPGCGVGSTAQEAIRNVRLAYLKPGINLVLAQGPGGGGGPGECDYTGEPFAGCSCNPGLATRSAQLQDSPVLIPANMRARPALVPVPVQPSPSNTFRAPPQVVVPDP